MLVIVIFCAEGSDHAGDDAPASTGVGTSRVSDAGAGGSASVPGVAAGVIVIERYSC
jgi:hypothetical protein